MNKATIKAGQSLTARSICDHGCIFTCEIISRKGNFAEVATDGGKRISRRKIYTCHDGSTEYVMAMGKYSMAPMFKAKSVE